MTTTHNTSKTNTLAIVSLASSFFIGLAGVVCARIALSQIEQTGEKGRAIAIAGFTVGILNILGLLIAAIAFTAASASVGS